MRSVLTLQVDGNFVFKAQARILNQGRDSKRIAYTLNQSVDNFEVERFFDIFYF